MGVMGHDEISRFMNSIEWPDSIRSACIRFDVKDGPVLVVERLLDSEDLKKLGAAFTEKAK